MQPRNIHWTPRAETEVDECIDFICRQPRGKPEDRELDIEQAIDEIRAYPEDNRPERYVPDTRLWLRRCEAAQLVIVYAYLRAKDPALPGTVGIRAVRHMRVADVFEGVRERIYEWRASDVE
jgi:plasmid stabilization system protein ParE